MSKKVLIPLANGFEEIEFITTIDILRRASIEVISASITENQYVTGSHNVVIKTDELFENIKDDNFEAIAIPGGSVGMEKLKNYSSLIKKIKDMNSENKLIAAICAASVILEEAQVIKNKFTCYPGFENRIHSGEYIQNDIVVKDENIVTSQGPATTMFFALEIVKYLLGEEKKTEVYKSILMHKII